MRKLFLKAIFCVSLLVAALTNLSCSQDVKDILQGDKCGVCIKNEGSSTITNWWVASCDEDGHESGIVYKLTNIIPIKPGEQSGYVTVPSEGWYQVQYIRNNEGLISLCPRFTFSGGGMIQTAIIH